MQPEKGSNCTNVVDVAVPLILSEFLALPCVSQVELLVDAVQYSPFVEAPWRVNEDGARGISCKSVDGDFRWDYFEAFNHQLYLCFNGAERLIVMVEFFHAGAFDDVQKMEFHAEKFRDG